MLAAPLREGDHAVDPLGALAGIGHQRDPHPAATGIDAAGVAPYALDPEAADRLWDVTEQMQR